MGISLGELEIWMKDIAGTARLITSQIKWLLVKAAPYILLPGTLLVTATGVLTNEEVWSYATDLLIALEGMSGNASGAMSPWLARMNYIFPMTETFIMVGFLIQLAIASLAVRVIKAVVEFILEVIPF